MGSAWGASAAALLLSVCLVLVEASLHANIARGLPPDGTLHSTATTFTCSDESTVLPIVYFNDDYCDCEDGSDEPGTSACSNGHFYCVNKGHSSLIVPSSRVNDGICDCCDGSDEWDGRMRCSNTCLEAGAALRAQLKKDSQAYSEGARLRNTYIADARTTRQKWEKQLTELKAGKTTHDKLVSALQEKKEKLEEEEKQERLWKEQERKEAEDREKELAAQSAQAEQAAGQTEASVKGGTSKETTLPNEPGAGEGAPSEGRADKQEGDPNPETGGAGSAEGASRKSSIREEASEAAKELSADELGQLVASRWTGHQEGVEFAEEAAAAAGAVAKVEQAAASEQGAAPTLEEHDDVSEDEDHDGLDLENAQEDAETQPAAPAATPVTAVGSALQKLATVPAALLKKARSLFTSTPPEHVPTSEVAEAQRAHSVEQSKQTEMSRKIADLETKLARDYGPDEAFLKMVDQCFELTVKHYVYKVCPFNEAVQLEGASSTRLGSWEGFESNYSTMKFSNGQHCWNGPQRSLKVLMKCSAKTELGHVDEPSRCEYTAELLTPAICTSEEAEALRSKLEEAERVARALKEEL